MPDCNDILISVAPDYSRAILRGHKTVELRRRRFDVAVGTRIWLYSKLPVGSIEATAIVEGICEATPETLWTQFKLVAGITRAAFDDYFQGCNQGYAVMLRDVGPVLPALNLSQLRAEFNGFHPPQFFKRLSCHHIKRLVARTKSLDLEKRSTRSGAGNN